MSAVKFAAGVPAETPRPDIEMLKALFDQMLNAWHYLDEAQARRKFRPKMKVILSAIGVPPAAPPPQEWPTWLKGRCWTCGEADNSIVHGKPRGLGVGVTEADFHKFAPFPVAPPAAPPPGREEPQ